MSLLAGMYVLGWAALGCGQSEGLAPLVEDTQSGSKTLYDLCIAENAHICAPHPAIPTMLLALDALYILP